VSYSDGVPCSEESPTAHSTTTDEHQPRGDSGEADSGVGGDGVCKGGVGSDGAHDREGDSDVLRGGHADAGAESREERAPSVTSREFNKTTGKWTAS
jgi:hypothetical protein